MQFAHTLFGGSKTGSNVLEIESKKKKKKLKQAKKFLGHCPISKTHNLISRKRKFGAAYVKITEIYSNTFLQKFRESNDFQ